MENKVFSKCGMRCDLCLIYRPNVEKEDRRAEICNVWKKVWHGFEPNPNTIICDGCCNESEDAILFNPTCEARSCVLEKGQVHCGYCEQYPCNIFPAEPTEEEIYQKIEVEKQWTWEEEKLMEAYACKKYMNEFREQNYIALIHSFVTESKRILGENLTGVYLHGSAVMGCFYARKSDIDLLVVVKDSLSKETKRKYMDMVVELNRQAPPKGLELSIVREAVCKPFVYPTPFELHFSNTHLNWYMSDPEDYVEKMNGTDKDLAAHFTIAYHRGKTLYGKEIRTVFAEVNREAYMDSIWMDIAGAKEEITENPIYIILNLCRVLAYKRESLILSKQEGGEWAMKTISVPEYKKLIVAALKEYQAGETMKVDHGIAREFAEYMLEQIKKVAI